MPSTIFDLTPPSLHSQDSLLLRAGAQIPLDLSLVHTIERQHHEDTPKSQSPESMAFIRIRVQAAEKEDETVWLTCLSNIPPADIAVSGT